MLRIGKKMGATYYAPSSPGTSFPAESSQLIIKEFTNESLHYSTSPHLGILQEPRGKASFPRILPAWCIVLGKRRLGDGLWPHHYHYHHYHEYISDPIFSSSSRSEQTLVYGTLGIGYGSHRESPPVGLSFPFFSDIHSPGLVWRWWWWGRSVSCPPFLPCGVLSFLDFWAL